MSDEDHEDPLQFVPLDEKWIMRCASAKYRNKTGASCFLLSSGEFTCAADGGIRKGMKDIDIEMDSQILLGPS
ncbi:hypothetical protein XELAEV_18002947mg [Xenopus laevis]|nr:hypothetical protein XELAEV_18002947mg [Xenopus laevis]